MKTALRRFGHSLVQLAQLNAEWRKYSTAEALFRNALELFEGLFGAEDNDHVASTLEAMALMYQRRGKHEIARPLQRRADSIKLKRRRRRLEKVAATSTAAASAEASLQQQQQRPEMPVMNLTTTMLASSTTTTTTSGGALPSPKRSNNNNDVSRQKQIASTFFNLGVRLCQQNKHANALPLLQGALTVFEAAVGPSHPLVVKTLRNLALVKYHLGDYEAAAECYKRAIDTEGGGGGGEEALTTRTSAFEEASDRRRFFFADEVVGAAGAKLGATGANLGAGAAESRRSSSDTMSTVKVGDDSTYGHQRAASTR